MNEKDIEKTVRMAVGVLQQRGKDFTDAYDSGAGRMFKETQVSEDASPTELGRPTFIFGRGLGIRSYVSDFDQTLSGPTSTQLDIFYNGVPVCRATLLRGALGGLKVRVDSAEEGEWIEKLKGFSRSDQPALLPA